ncbi:MAG: adenylate/guanylate cyclase domain-containing protein, partial [Pseudomonadota bacterium]
MSSYAETAGGSLTGDSAERTETIETNRFAAKALEDHKREGLYLAVRARWVALAVIGVMLPFLNPNPEVIYYQVLLALFA